MTSKADREIILDLQRQIGALTAQLAESKMTSQALRQEMARTAAAGVNTPAEPQEPVDPKNFLADLDPPKYDVIERTRTATAKRAFCSCGTCEECVTLNGCGCSAKGACYGCR